MTRSALTDDLARLQDRGAREDGPPRGGAPGGTWRREADADRRPGLPPGGRPPCAESSKAEWPFHAAVFCGRIAPAVPELQKLAAEAMEAALWGQLQPEVQPPEPDLW